MVDVTGAFKTNLIKTAPCYETGFVNKSKLL